jgi:uncharacterized membrane protein
MEAGIAGTALPNLHPAVIHFPLAFLPLAALVDLAAAARRGRSGLSGGAAALWVAGAITAWVAFISGRQAADSIAGIQPGVQALVGDHHDWAWRTVLYFSGLAAIRGAAQWWGRRRGRLPIAVHGPLVVVGVVGLALLLGTADRGGALVYRHGLAVAIPGAGMTESEESSPDGRPPDARAPVEAADGDGRTVPFTALRETPDGTRTWSPKPSDTGSIGTVLTRSGSGNGTVSVSGGEGAGLSLRIDGRVLLLFEPVLDGVQVEMDVDPRSFSGTIGLAHHVGANGTAGLFELDLRTGEARLLRRGEDEATLATETTEAPNHAFTLAAYSSGHHWRGLIDGRTVTHGHGEPPPAGRIGLLFDGSGTVGIREVRLIPVVTD